MISSRSRSARHFAYHRSVWKILHHLTMVVHERPILIAELFVRFERHLIGRHHIDHVGRDHLPVDALHHLRSIARKVYRSA